MAKPQHVFDIDTTRKVEIRNLEEGDWFIHVRHLNRANIIGHMLRKIGHFKARTVLESTVEIFPSDKVHPATVVESENDDDKPETAA